MKRDLAALADTPFDVLVVGGGILGAGIARDAALRGLRVALIDQEDFASGTSSRSTKLIHGGFRYLEQAAFGLVIEACRERRILQTIAPHLVQPRSFLLPVYRGEPRGLAAIRLGMTLYDLLAFYRNTAPHQSLSPEHTLTTEPQLARTGLRGAVLFHDCQEDDARFCLENVLHAADRGAVCANYCALIGFVARGNRLVAAQVADRAGTGTFEIRARVFVNAAGPWVERVADLAPFNGRPVALSATRGVHLLFPQFTTPHGVFFQARRDGRILFVVPWHDCSIVGSTDTDFVGDPARARTGPADIDYLCEEARAILPDTPIDESAILTTFAGVRPLLRSNARATARSREHRLIRQGDNLLSVVGGKFTTYRAIAEQAVNRVYQLLGQSRPPCTTATTPLPVHRPPPGGESIAPLPTIHASDIAHACDHEMALTLTDVMRRRTSLALSRHATPPVAERVARLMAPRLHWTEAQRAEQVRQYVQEWKRARP